MATSTRSGRGCRPATSPPSSSSRSRAKAASTARRRATSTARSRFAAKHGALSILDEIQTGLGRTGALFACSSGTEVPDMLLLAKALGGGLLPIGACIARPSAWDDRFGRLHSSTFAGNGLACAAGLATLDLLLADDSALIAQVRENGAVLKRGLEALRDTFPEVIRDVRGQGYMLGLEFQRFDDRGSAAMAFASLNGGVTALISSYLMNVEGLLTAPLFNASHVLRLQPPLIAGRAEIDRALSALGALCDVLNRRDTRPSSATSSRRRRRPSRSTPANPDRGAPMARSRRSPVPSVSSSTIPRRRTSSGRILRSANSSRTSLRVGRTG
jgi:hypothetical protein